VAQLAGLELIWLEDLRERFGLLDKAWLMGFALWFPEAAMPEGDPEAPAVVLFTSGTEGKPKGVVLSHRALLANVDQVIGLLRFSTRDVVFNSLPIFHSFGLTAGTLVPLVTGSRLVIYPSPLHFKEIPKLVRDRGATVLFGTSTFFNHYARNAEAGDFASLKYVVAVQPAFGQPAGHGGAAGGRRRGATGAGARHRAWRRTACARPQPHVRLLPS
jgi:acyl-[acyl-carrier-protein]-phospholipid O-acyltransferase/long-chain-fatty-acid--[acyl-carrier-protein] ligase